MELQNSYIVKTLIDLYHNAYIDLILIIIFTIIANYLTHIIFKKTQSILQKKPKLELTRIFISASKGPTHYFLVITALDFISDIFSQYYKIFRAKQYLAFETSLIILAFLWFAISLINHLEAFWLTGVSAQDKKFDKTSISASSKILRITSVVIVLLILLDVNGISISGILAFGGVSGVAVGFASKDMLSNFFGTFMIYLDKPFKIGDWVKIPDKGIEGHIESIGMRCTIIRSLERRPIYIPNSLFSNVAIENPSRMSHRQIHETFSLRYEDLPVVENIINDIKSSLKHNQDIDTKQPLVVSISSISSAVISIMIYTFTKKVDFEEYNEVKQQIFLAISKVIQKYEAEITYIPQSIAATVQKQSIKISDVVRRKKK